MAERLRARGGGVELQRHSTGIGTPQPVIARLEDAGHEGHAFSMLQRIATDLGRAVAALARHAAGPLAFGPPLAGAPRASRARGV
ncbi:MAG: hypothetical protein OEQ13_08060 [Acidobacteriota bacterium]|nr:hypothetical protein [Acidobacteriota bacterium]